MASAASAGLPNTSPAIDNSGTVALIQNRAEQHGVINVFVTGACVFPQNAGKNPTGPVGALAYWIADALKDKYLKRPGALVPV